MAPRDTSEWLKPNAEFEEALKTAPKPPAFQNDLPTMRKTLLDSKREMTRVLLKDSSGVETVDMTVPGRDGQQIPIRLYKPKGAKEELPLAIFMHGGGFCLGGLENEEALCTFFAQKNGVIAVNIDYSLAPEKPWPQAPNEAWDVVKWISENAKSIGADLSKGFIAGGVSAGANLAAVVTHLARDEKLKTPFTGMLLQCPPLIDARNIDEKYLPELTSMEENKDAPILNAKAVDNLLNNTYKPDPKSKFFNLFAPPTDFSGLPPMWIAVCGMDPIRDEGILYERLLREQGTKTKLIIYPGLPHGFWSFLPYLKVSQQVIDDTIEGLDWLLRQGE